MTITDEEFKACLGCFATGVTIVTTQEDAGTFAGLTVNSFSSVSLHPPYILFSIDHDASHYETFAKSNYFGISILSAGQQDLSEKFAHPSVVDWNTTSFSMGNIACPLFDNSHATIEAIREVLYDGGDHSIFLCKILHTQIDNTQSPLVYYQGNYHQLTS